MVAIPLEQGRFFNWSCSGASTAPIVAIPLEQGRFFNYELDVIGLCCESQSLWSRDGFSMGLFHQPERQATSQSLWSRDGFSIVSFVKKLQLAQVAIPLEQGRFFNSEVCFSFLFLGY